MEYGAGARQGDNTTARQDEGARTSQDRSPQEEISRRDTASTRTSEEDITKSTQEKQEDEVYYYQILVEGENEGLSLFIEDCIEPWEFSDDWEEVFQDHGFLQTEEAWLKTHQPARMKSDVISSSGAVHSSTNTGVRSQPLTGQSDDIVVLDEDLPDLPEVGRTQDFREVLASIPSSQPAAHRNQRKSKKDNSGKVREHQQNVKSTGRKKYMDDVGESVQGKRKSCSKSGQPVMHSKTNSHVDIIVLSDDDDDVITLDDDNDIIYVDPMTAIIEESKELLRAKIAKVRQERQQKQDLEALREKVLQPIPLTNTQEDISNSSEENSTDDLPNLMIPSAFTHSTHHPSHANPTVSQTVTVSQPVSQTTTEKQDIQIAQGCEKTSNGKERTSKKHKKEKKSHKKMERKKDKHRKTKERDKKKDKNRSDKKLKSKNSENKEKSSESKQTTASGEFVGLQNKEEKRKSHSPDRNTKRRTSSHHRKERRNSSNKGKGERNSSDEGKKERNSLDEGKKRRKSCDEGKEERKSSDEGKEKRQSSDEGKERRKSLDEGKKRRKSSDEGKERRKSSDERKKRKLSDEEEEEEERRKSSDERKKRKKSSDERNVRSSSEADEHKSEPFDMGKQEPQESRIIPCTVSTSAVPDSTTPDSTLNNPFPDSSTQPAQPPVDILSCLQIFSRQTCVLGQLTSSLDQLVVQARAEKEQGRNLEDFLLVEGNINVLKLLNERLTSLVLKNEIPAFLNKVTRETLNELERLLDKKKKSSEECDEFLGLVMDRVVLSTMDSTTQQVITFIKLMLTYNGITNPTVNQLRTIYLETMRRRMKLIAKMNQDVNTSQSNSLSSSGTSDKIPNKTDSGAWEVFRLIHLAQFSKAIENMKTQGTAKLTSNLPDETSDAHSAPDNGKNVHAFQNNLLEHGAGMGKNQDTQTLSHSGGTPGDTYGWGLGSVPSAATPPAKDVAATALIHIPHHPSTSTLPSDFVLNNQSAFHSGYPSQGCGGSAATTGQPVFSLPPTTGMGASPSNFSDSHNQNNLNQRTNSYFFVQNRQNFDEKFQSAQNRNTSSSPCFDPLNSLGQQWRESPT